MFALSTFITTTKKHHYNTKYFINPKTKNMETL